MKTLRRWLNVVLRGRLATRLLLRLGVQPKQYWLLTDLFGELAERRELMGNLGTNTTALRLNALLLCGMTAFVTVICLLAGVQLSLYFVLFTGLTGVLLMGMLFSEAGNSLVNPAEGLVMAHQPINGATYTTAKLTHLLRILLYLVPALDAVPALGGLLLGAPWYYPLLHMAAAFTLGMVIALLCCATFGWLIRFVPARRLKTAGQLAEVLPWTLFMVIQYSQSAIRHVNFAKYIPTSMSTRIWLGAALATVSVAAVAMGLRNLSGDYLVRISAIIHGSSGAKSKVRRSRTSDLVARMFGGPGARAGYEYLSRLMRRDWQLRRQLIPMLPGLVLLVALSVKDLRHSPFSGEFSGVQVLPHFCGLIFFSLCPILVFGSDYKGTWIFLLAPAGIFRGFTRGLYAFLWLRLVVTPHLILMAILAWVWGPTDAVLFTVYSIGVVSVYLSLEIRLIEGMPFSRQPQPTRQNFLMPIMAMGTLAAGAAVALQHFLLFRSRLAVLVVAAALGVVAWLVTRWSLDAVETNIRYDLDVMAQEGRGIFKEVEV